MLKDRSLLMIPGPTEFHEEVISSFGEPTLSHTDPKLIQSFGESIELFRKLVGTVNGQPFLIGGSGTLGWDMTACNLVEPGDQVLVINTGYFGDRFGECLERYGAKVTHIRPTQIGGVPPLDSIEKALKSSSSPYKLVTITHVDTSTGVLMNIKETAAMIKNTSPQSLIVVDGVCSIAAESFYFDAWNIDVILTGSQKAIGIPPGLLLMCVSQKALQIRTCRKSTVTNWYGDFLNWLPIHAAYESRKPSYFATPPTNHIVSLSVALKHILSRGIEPNSQKHALVSTAFKTALQSIGLQTVPKSIDISAHTMTAVYFPDGVDGSKFLPLFPQKGVIVAGGLLADIKTKYFRIGHMGISAVETHRGHLLRVLQVLDACLLECGYKLTAGQSSAVFEDIIKKGNK